MCVLRVMDHGLGCAFSIVTLVTDDLNISKGDLINCESPDRVEPLERIRYPCRSGPAHAMRTTKSFHVLKRTRLLNRDPREILRLSNESRLYGRADEGDRRREPDNEYELAGTVSRACVQYGHLCPRNVLFDTRHVFGP
jgi:hypothetical protein